MLKVLNQSLFLRLGLSMALIIALAFMGMLSTVFVAEISEGQAAAINQAGSLRMQSYRVASALAQYTGDNAVPPAIPVSALVTEFERRLHDARLTGILNKIDDVRLTTAYTSVMREWRNIYEPLLQTYLQYVTSEPARARVAAQEYQRNIDDFVVTIDAMVKALETSAEDNIHNIRLIQISALFLTLLVAFVTLYRMHNKVLAPLRELSQCAKAVRAGDFSVRAHYASEDELGQLSYAFNTMAADLLKMYRDLEARVRAKTSDLERSNRSLELLYRTTRRLSEAPLTDEVYQELLQDIYDVIGIGPGSICLGESGDSHAIKLANTRGKPVPGSIDICNPPDCEACFAGAASHTVIKSVAVHTITPMLAIPIKDMEKQYGVLLLETPVHGELLAWQQILLETVASHIAMALKMAQRTSQARMLALLEERGVIARELHDSLAQSLSYLKIQVSRLDATLAESGNESKLKSIVDELRDGLNSAYRQLRELLTTFRLRMDEAGFDRALLATIDEFQRRGGALRITLENQLGNCKLGPNAEINVIQLIREALANVVQHARATQAVVSLRCDVDNQVTVAIDDNGIGMVNNNGRYHHYGLTIMRERALAMGGELQILVSGLGGTRLYVLFNAKTPPALQQVAT